MHFSAHVTPLRRLALATLVPLASCGGDGSSPTPPEGGGQTVTVSVVTTGQDLDADGYTVTLGSRSEAVGVNGSVSFDDVPPGTHTVTLTGVAENCSVEGEASRSVSVTASTGAQVAFAVVCVFDFGDEFATVSCSALGPTTSAGLPGERIDVGAVPAGFEPPLFARVLLEDGSAGGHTFLSTDEEGVLGLVVPIHPSLRPEGGQVRIRVSDGAVACLPFDLVIEPLTPNPDELDAIVDLLQEILRQQASLLGTTPEELVATPLDQLPTYLVPLGAVQSVLDHPGNENSLAAIADGTAPSVPDARLDLLEPLLAQAGVRQALEASLAAAAPVALPVSAGASVLLCTPEDIQMDDPGLLDHCMDVQASAAFRLEGATGQVLKKMGDLMGVLGFVPGLGAFAGAGGAVLWAALNADSRTAALLPSALVHMDLMADPGWFYEDEGLKGVWEADVTAESAGGWDLGKEMIEALLQVVGALGALDKADSSREPIDELLGTLAGPASGPISEQLLKDGTLEEFMIPAETFGPVSIDHEDWSQARIIGDAVVLDETDHVVYEPWLAGPAVLSVRTKDGEFGGKQIAEQIELEVREIDLDIEPEEVVLEPEEPKEFEVTVTNSKHPEAVALDPAPAQGTAVIEYLGEGVHRVSYQAPAEPDPDTDDLLVVRHTAESGARVNSTEPRTATATIRFATVEISASATSCVAPGQVVTLVAEVEGFDAPTVVWHREGPATLESTGDLTATLTPTNEGVVTVTAHVERHPQLDDEVTILVGGCTCSWSVDLNGTVIESQPGDKATFQEFDVGGDFTALADIELETADGRVVHLIGDSEYDGYAGMIQSEGPGTYEGHVAGNIGTADPFTYFNTMYKTPDAGWTGDEPLWTSAELTLDEYVIATRLRGSVVGQVNIDEYERLSFGATFEIIVPPDYSEVLAYQRTFTCTVPQDDGGP